MREDHTTPVELDPEELLSKDHSELDQLLSALRTVLNGTDVGKIYLRLDLFWGRLAMHIRAEHLHLFPTIINSIERKDSDEAEWSHQVRESVEQLREDHDFFMHELAKAIKMLRRLQSGAEPNESVGVLMEVREVVRNVSVRLAIHNAVEEEITYELPRKLLTDSERLILGRRIRNELGNLPQRLR